MIIIGKVTSEVHLKGEMRTGHYGSAGYGAKGETVYKPLGSVSYFNNQYSHSSCTS